MTNTNIRYRQRRRGSLTRNFFSVNEQDCSVCFSSTTSFFSIKPPPSDVFITCHCTACSFCFGLRAEGSRPIKQTEVLMCQCGSQTLVYFPDGEQETNGGSIEHFSHVSNVKDRKAAAWVLVSAYGCWVLL